MPENVISTINNSVDNNNDKQADEPGLVVTISRQKGCGALPIANLIIKDLNAIRKKDVKSPKWKLISKEILKESSEHLKISPSQVDSIIDMNVLQKLMFSFSTKTPPKDSIIKNTIQEVILNAAKRGNIIIVGRGGVSITRDMKNSLHIKLVAPLEWRINKIASKNNISMEEADSVVMERDRQRDIFKKYFLGDKEADIHLYDCIVNVSTMTKREVADAISSIIKVRQEALVP